MKNIQLEWAEGVKLLKGEDKTLVANINNAKGMFVSNDVFILFKRHLKTSYLFQKF